MEVDTVGTKPVAVPGGWTWTIKKRIKGKTAEKFDWYIIK